jgi:hypothetical protein
MGEIICKAGKDKQEWGKHRGDNLKCGGNGGKHGGDNLQGGEGHKRVGETGGEAWER